jgi:hypothetical protein
VARITTDHLCGRPFLAFARAAPAVQRLILQSFPCFLHLKIEAFLRADDVAVVTWHDSIGLLPLQLLVHASNTYEILAF